jgi:hypothetical protein
VVISRVALPYMHLPTALNEIARVLKPGGHVWFALHPASMLRRRWRKSFQRADLKDIVYSSYILANGLLFHHTGRLIRFPLNRRRCESFQTVEGMTRVLRGHRLEVAHAATDPFVVSAVKQSTPGQPIG